MKARRLVPYAIALLILAWTLGSLPRSQPGGSILVNSYWLLYILDLIPLLGLGALALLAIFIVLYLRLLSDSLGFGIAKKVKKSRKHWVLRILIFLYASAFALVYLMMNCTGPFCQASNKNAVQGLEKMVLAGNSASPNLPNLQGKVAGFTSAVPWGWFFPVFIGLLLASSVVMIRSFIVAFRDSKLEAREEIRAAQREGLEAVQEAIRIVSDPDLADPKMRIIDCYRRLITTGSRLGARITPEQTARELEQSMRRTFLLGGPAIGELTALFEEARYSLHPISEDDALEAQGCLAQIAHEISPDQFPPMTKNSKR